MRQKTEMYLEFVTESHDPDALITTIIVDTESSEVALGQYDLQIESYAMNELERVVETLAIPVYVTDFSRSEEIPEFIEIKKSDGTFIFSIK